jgi:hypothetical protein
MSQPIHQFANPFGNDAEQHRPHRTTKENWESWARSNVHFLVAALGITVGIVGIAWQRMAAPTTAQKIKRRLKVIEKQHYDFPKAA